MEIHKPKPVHNWREFLTEIGTIVIGILIALGLEQSIEALHERHLAQEASKAIHAEMQEDLRRIAAHRALQPCNDRRLNEIAALLKDWKNGTPPPAGLVIGDPGDLPLVDQRWQANLNSGRFSQQSDALQSEQAGFYTRLAILNTTLDREHATWAQLRALELGPDLLSADMRPALVAALQSARTHARDLAFIGRLQEEEFKHIIGPTKAVRDVTVSGDTCQPLLG